MILQSLYLPGAMLFQTLLQIWTDFKIKYLLNIVVVGVAKCPILDRYNKNKHVSEIIKNYLNIFIMATNLGGVLVQAIKKCECLALTH